MAISAAAVPSSGRDLLIDARDVFRARGAARGLRAEVEREDRGGLTIGRVEDSVGPECERADG